MVQFSNGRHILLGPGEWQKENASLAAAQQDRRHNDDKMAMAFENMARDLAEMKKKEEQRGIENDRAERGLTENIASSKARTADTTRRTDLLSDGADDDRKRREEEDAERKRQRDARAGIFAGLNKPKSAATVAAPQRPTAEGPTQPGLNVDGELDLDGNGIPDELEMQDHDDETQAMMDAVAPYFAGSDDATQKNLLDNFTQRRAQGRNTLRGKQVVARVGNAVRLGLVSPEDPQIQRGMQYLQQGGDPDALNAYIDDIEDAAEKTRADDMIRSVAMMDVQQTEQAAMQLVATGRMHLNAVQMDEIALLKSKMMSPRTSAKEAYAISEKLRNKLFGGKSTSESGKGAESWRDNDAIVAILKDPLNGTVKERLAQAKEMARGMGLKGVPMDDAPQGTPVGEGEAPVDAPREDKSVRYGLEEELGRTPTPEELAERLRSMDSAGAAQQPEPVQTQEEMIQSKLGADRSAYPPVPGQSAQRDPEAFERMRGPKKPMMDIARKAGVQFEDEYEEKKPGIYSEQEAREMHKRDSRLLFKRNRRGGYDIVGANDLSRKSDPKTVIANE